MRIFKTRWFVRFARQYGIKDMFLCDAIARAERGRIDADLGGGVIKQRIARSGEGKSGGFRSIILFRTADRAFFVYGFPKQVKSNLRKDELKSFKALADEMLDYSGVRLSRALRAGALVEVKCDE